MKASFAIFRTARAMLVGATAGAAIAAVQAGAAPLPEETHMCRGADGRTALRPAKEPHADCTPVTLPLALSRVRWAHFVPEPVTGPSPKLLLEGTRRNGVFDPVSARVARLPGRPERPPIVTIGDSILPLLEAAPFGIEERARAEMQAGAVKIVCGSGQKPAGLLFNLKGRRLAEGAALEIAAQAQGGLGFWLGVAERGGVAEALVPLQPGAQVTLPVPDRKGLRDAPSFVVVCPNAAAEIRLTELSLVPGRAPASPLLRSAWAWNPRNWREEPGSLLEAATRQGIGRIFVAVEIDGPALRHASELAAFVSRAQAAGISVFAVEGDPAMVLPAGRSAAVARLRAIAAFQQEAPADARLAGVQYDIEPYLLPAYAADPQGVLAGWAETLEELAAAAGALPLDMALPFWLPLDEAAAATVLPAAAASARSITAMSYRTNLPALQAAAEPLLAWGARAGVPVHVGLEAGPVDDEVTRTFRENPAGNLWVLPQGSGSLVLLVEGEAAPPGVRTFALERETVARADTVSFLGDRAKMTSLADRSVPFLKAWPNFAGLAFHGLLE